MELTYSLIEQLIFIFQTCSQPPIFMSFKLTDAFWNNVDEIKLYFQTLWDA